MNYNPIISIATATLEVAAGVWALRGPGRKAIINTTSTILFFLAAYQIIEAIFCTGSPVTFAFLPRLAFMVVAWLPPTGLLLVSFLYPTTKPFLRYLSFAMFVFCGGLVAGIFMDRSFVSATVCEIVFATYTNPTQLFHTYGLFYQSGLAGMLFISAYGVTICKDDHQRFLLGQVMLGCMAFIFPALAAITMLPISEKAFSSILCHFAVLLAIFLVRLLWAERKAAVGESSGQMLEPANGGLA